MYPGAPMMAPPGMPQLYPYPPAPIPGMPPVPPAIQAPPETKLFVGGIPLTASSASLGAYFAQFGSVLEARIVVDKLTGRSKGYAFVTFADAEGAARAAAPGSHPIDGKNCNVNLVSQKEQAMAQFQQENPNRKRPSDGDDGGDPKRRRIGDTSASVSYPGGMPAHVAAAWATAPVVPAPAYPGYPLMPPMHGMPSIPGAYPPPGRPGDPKIFISGLNFTTHEETLRQALGIFGELEEVHIVADKETNESKGYAFATFVDPAAAARAAGCQVLYIEGRSCKTNLASAKPSKR